MHTNVDQINLKTERIIEKLDELIGLIRNRAQPPVTPLSPEVEKAIIKAIQNAQFPPAPKVN